MPTPLPSDADFQAPACFTVAINNAQRVALARGLSELLGVFPDHEEVTLLLGMLNDVPVMPDATSVVHDFTA